MADHYDDGGPGAGASDAGSGGDGLSPAERAELQRLRAEVSALHRREAATARRRRSGWRTPVASVLIFLGCLLAPVSVIGVWAASQVSSTDRYVATVSPLISDPAVQQALTTRITHAIITRLNMTGATDRAAAALTDRGMPQAGKLLDAASGSIVSSVNGFVHDRVAQFVASPRAAQLWANANRTLHEQMVKVLSGQANAVTVVNGQVVIGLGPFIEAAKHEVAARGLTLANAIPPVNPAFPLFPAKTLVRAQTAYQWLTTLKIVLPIVAVVFLGLGVYAARSHRRALIGVGLGVAASMLVLGAALVIARSVFLGSLPAGVSAAAVTAAYDTMVRFMKDGLRLLLVAGLIVALGAFFTGPSVTAVRTRDTAKRGLGWIRASGDKAGLRTGRVGQWTYAHRKGLRISAVALAAIIFVFWSQPSGVVALVLALILVVVLGLIELIGKPPAKPAASTGARTRA